MGSFLLNLSMFVVARVLYNIENNNDILNINFLDYFNYGFIERLKMIAMHSFMFLFIRETLAIHQHPLFKRESIC